MPTWNTDQYLKFANERTQPSLDLVNRIPLVAPRRIIDLGCGPGNSTAVVAQRWPGATIVGLDNSAAMLATARREHPEWTWLQDDIARWAATTAKDGTERFEVVFANAALQWVANHRTVVPAIFETVASGGALAFQVPHTLEAPHQRCIRDLALSATWSRRFTRPPTSWHVESADFYYDVLTPRATRVELWLTDYAHVLAGPEAIVEWYRGTGLRPFLEALPDETARAEFLRDYLSAIAPHYPPRPDGRVIMYFRRLFVVALR